MPADVRQQLEKWRRDERETEEVEYRRNAGELNAFLKGSEGRMPQCFRKPRNDDETKQVALARFVRKYSASIVDCGRRRC